MLESLDVHNGMRVLEIGTGTGYNTALLCHGLGDSQGYTVDLDPVLVDRSRAALNEVGYRPHAAVADGSEGWSPGAPYDRIISTAATSHIPASWIDQLAPDGVIVTDVRRDIGGAMVVLRKIGVDRVEGRFAAFQTVFMPLRREVDHPRRDGTVTTEPIGATRSGPRRSFPWR